MHSVPDPILNFLADPESPNPEIKPYLINKLQPIFPYKFIKQNAGNFVNLISLASETCESQYLPRFIDIINIAEVPSEIIRTYPNLFAKILEFYINLVMNDNFDENLYKYSMKQILPMKKSKPDIFDADFPQFHECLQNILGTQDIALRIDFLFRFFRLCPVFSNSFNKLIIKIIYRHMHGFYEENHAVPKHIKHLKALYNFMENDSGDFIRFYLRNKFVRESPIIEAGILLSKLVRGFDDKYRLEICNSMLSKIINLLQQPNMPRYLLFYASKGFLAYHNNQPFRMNTYFPFLNANVDNPEFQRTILKCVLSLHETVDESNENYFSKFISDHFQNILAENYDKVFRLMRRIVCYMQEGEIIDFLLEFNLAILQGSSYPLNAHALVILYYICYYNSDLIPLYKEKGIFNFAILLLQSEKAEDFDMVNSFFTEILQDDLYVDEFHDILMAAYVEFVKYAVGTYNCSPEYRQTCCSDAVILMDFLDTEETPFPEEFVFPFNSVTDMIKSNEFPLQVSANYVIADHLDMFDPSFVLQILEYYDQIMKERDCSALFMSMFYLIYKILDVCDEVPEIILNIVINIFSCQYKPFIETNFEYNLTVSKHFYRSVVGLVRLGHFEFIIHIIDSLPFVSSHLYGGMCRTIMRYVKNAQLAEEDIDSMYFTIFEVFKDNYDDEHAQNIANLLTNIFLMRNAAYPVQELIDVINSMVEAIVETRESYIICMLNILAVTDPNSLENPNISTLSSAIFHVSNFKSKMKIDYDAVFAAIRNFLYENAESYDLVVECGVFIAGAYLLRPKERSQFFRTKIDEDIMKGLTYICENFRSYAKAVWDHFRDKDYQILGEIFSKYFERP
ncbi:hypothetical protein TVAG_393020 [Trichomonas vaginalis G3]|uniref:Uncharacterized protein n=1 Tax=Trichomonas vaginalis (strain ATCC PRA-98 / G3) TaxID=412133 RepID=A2DY98_TRIV3|nr:armadillo (ARM) repeat-containing protein family [Trichomonas vaginalis G3]EAY14575.1 hypothetical protein TVAG_393020 [Trichomonas vaginalis G3]KAI5526585.1 armadillo (ARM) repeat-containing protein family [Trichomonas vaginalis G3]|eukprot:XP_001326798.1 hypothetical protein [Trichomonas vaginalis G3]